MEQEKKEVDATLDSFADSGVEVPQSHWVIHENIWFIGSMVKKVRSKEWTLNDVKEFLESRGYKRETVSRFVHAVALQLNQGAEGATPREERPTEKPPSSEPKPRKPKRSEGAMTPEEIEKIKDPEARRLAKEYLDATETSTGEAGPASSIDAEKSTKGADATRKKDQAVKKTKKRTRHQTL
jgi:hypothetical protein